MLHTRTNDYTLCSKKPELKSRRICKSSYSPISPPTIKENAWNKRRITPTITNFLVLIFSIIAPAIFKVSLSLELNAKKRKSLHPGGPVRCPRLSARHGLCLKTPVNCPCCALHRELWEKGMNT